MLAERDPLTLLASTTNPDGGYGYRNGQPSQLEPTCLAMLAFGAMPETYAKEIAAAAGALEKHARPDGSYRLDIGRPQAAWPTALVLFARACLNHPASELQPIANRLLALESKVVRMETTDAGDIDAGLLGWSWAEETFSWVEPTAWACLALRTVGLGKHPRVQEGLRLLLDRAHDDGGANYGSRVILGQQTEPMPGPTALLLLALQGVDHVRVDAAKVYLEASAERSDDVETLAWIKIALAAHATSDAARSSLAALNVRLQRALDAEADVGPHRLALASLALRSETYAPFRRTDAPIVATRTILGCTREAVPDEAMPAKSNATGFFGKLKAGMQSFLLRGTASLRPLPATSAVHIGRASDYDGDLLSVLKVQFEHFRSIVPLAGKRVVLKPNLVEFNPAKVINTDPRFVDAVIQLCQAEGAAEVVVAEGPGHCRNVLELVRSSGLGDVLQRRGVRFVDINHDEPLKLPNLGRTTGLESLYFSKTVAEAEVLISLPKLKTHHWAGATLSLKNLFGTLPGTCYGWPKNELHWRGIPNSIVDIALTCTPHLAIIDGIVGMEGDGPLAGRARAVGAIVMGHDLLAVDATGCRLMGLPPERLPTLRLAEQNRLGRLREADIPQLGEPISALRQNFELPPGIDKQLLPAGK